ncbi:hypothetical protein F3Y22_tig00013808pilonHSYRG00078 [Hibiscus syriacus]|uniref:Uncharacterized protein n=1 Tax=Hibiscus syriacus TaxID=106335 RepID=A0A6A3C0P1_HIBSY|nr:hypothetical protein F3Y22_tig00013808pilonHSYRG00078 [Hibiscus syriacus]
MFGSGECGEIPDGFGEVLRDLRLPNCEKLESLSPLPSSLENLNVANCISLENLSDHFNLEGLKDLNLTNCEKLADIPGLELIESSRTLYMSYCSKEKAL